MIIRRILIFTPLCLIILLLQSYFWVPTYEQQTRGNPERFSEYLTASIGDATRLNPILSTDASSSEIETKVFEGLLDYDENLHFRGRLATGWKVYEEAYFYINESVSAPNLGRATPQNIIDLLESEQQKENRRPADLGRTLANIRSISVLPPRSWQEVRELKDPSGSRKKRKYTLEASAPARIKLVLEQVDQNLFDNLTRILGPDYFAGFEARNYLNVRPAVGADQFARWADEILPAVAHNPVIEFSLRPGVRFHDGHVFDAEDVKFTYDSIMNPANLSPRIADYEPVKSVQVIDPLTVRITYKRLYSPAIGTWAMGILPAHILNARALQNEARRLGKDPAEFSMRQSAFNRHPIGCGPFVFREWKSDQYIILDRFENYWEGPANYQRYVFRIIPDLLTQEMEFYAGTLDAYGGGNPPHGIPPHQIDRFKRDRRYQTISDTAFGYTYIGYNMRRKPFDDPRVRRALSMAIDVDKIIKFVLNDQGERITGPFVKQTDFYNHQVKSIPYDPQGALALLRRAGWQRDADGWLVKDGSRLQFTLISNSGNDQRKSVLAIAQNAWRQLGIDVRTDLVEWSVFIEERVKKSDFDALILGWAMSVEPDLFQIWHSSQTGPHQLNFVAFKHGAADDLIIKIRQEYDHDRKVQYCHRLHEIIATELPYTFLFVRKWTAVLDKRIVIKDTDARGDTIYRKITPTMTGQLGFYFDKWIKLSRVPRLAP
jgi:ABC-type transport system substrate-binding protein